MENNIPAFPQKSNIGFSGMTLRDYFAGQTLSRIAYSPIQLLHCYNQIAEECYKIADAMLRERNKTQGETNDR